MKSKLSGKKDPKSSKDDSQPTTSAKASTSALNKAPQARPVSAAREKPSLPILGEAALAQYYSEALPSFRDVSPAEKQNLFVSKLHLCSFTFDFTDPTKHVREKEIKRQTLLELVDYANSGAGKFTEPVSEDIIFMLSNNLFRTLPPARSHDVDNYDAEEEEPSLDPAWPHLQVGRRCCVHDVAATTRAGRGRPEGAHCHVCHEHGVEGFVPRTGLLPGRRWRNAPL